MIAWINFAALLLVSMLFAVFYMRSVSPAGMSKVIGLRAYDLCGRLRAIAIGFELLIAANYGLMYFFPLPSPLPTRFPWPWWVSALIALAIGIPSSYLMGIGLKDAGEEAAFPKVEHTLYTGIYTKIRHPQAAGEVILFWSMAFLAHSPFLALFSFIYLPIFLLFCWAEEQDLLLRYGDNYAVYMQQTGMFIPKQNR